jgi:hypothetical protein
MFVGPAAASVSQHEMELKANWTESRGWGKLYVDIFTSCRVQSRYSSVRQTKSEIIPSRQTCDINRETEIGSHSQKNSLVRQRI